MTFVPHYEEIAKLDDPTIQQVVPKLSGADLVTALAGAPAHIKEAVYRNLSERGRNAISEARMETLKG